MLRMNFLFVVVGVCAFQRENVVKLFEIRVKIDQI